MEAPTMSRLLTHRIATMTEMREPHKVLDSSGGKPVAIMKNSRCVGYFVPADAVEDREIAFASSEDISRILNETRAQDAETISYLKDK